MSARVPWAPRLLLRVVTPRALWASLDGDLTEEFERNRQTLGAKRAVHRYQRDVWGSVWPMLTVDVAWRSLPRMIVATAAGVLATGYVSYVIGMAIGGAESALIIHVAAIILFAPLIGYGAAWVAGAGTLVVTAVVGVLVVLPAALSVGKIEEPIWLVTMWIMLVPPATLLGGLWQRQEVVSP